MFWGPGLIENGYAFMKYRRKGNEKHDWIGIGALVLRSDTSIQLTLLKKQFKHEKTDILRKCILDLGKKLFFEDYRLFICTFYNIVAEEIRVCNGSFVQRSEDITEFNPIYSYIMPN